MPVCYYLVMSTSTPQRVFEDLTRGLPRFNDGRINFTGVRKAPVLNVVVFYEGKILIVKRSRKVGSYKGLWNGISGFIDEPKTIDDFAKQELAEELSLDTKLISKIKVCTPYEVNDLAIDRIWFVYPVLVTLNQKPNIVLDWEHTDYAWIEPVQLEDYKCVKDFDISVTKALAKL